MSIPPGGEIGDEVHPDTDQVFLFVDWPRRGRHRRPAPGGRPRRPRLRPRRQPPQHPGQGGRPASAHHDLCAARARPGHRPRDQGGGRRRRALTRVVPVARYCAPHPELRRQRRGSDWAAVESKWPARRPAVWCSGSDRGQTAAACGSGSGDAACAALRPRSGGSARGSGRTRGRPPRASAAWPSSRPKRSLRTRCSRPSRLSRTLCDLLAEHRVGDRLDRGDGVLVLDQVAELGVALVADRGLERDGLAAERLDLLDPLRRDRRLRIVDRTRRSRRSSARGRGSPSGHG